MPAQPTSDQSPGPNLRDWAQLLALGVIWGASFMAVTIATRGLGPLSIAAGRITLGALALLLLSRMLRLHFPSLTDGTGRRTWLFAAGLGFFSMVQPFFLLSWAQLRVASGFAGVSMAMSPLLTLFLAHFLIPGERMSASKLLGILIGFVGVVVLIGPGALGSSGAAGEGLAQLACAGAAASYAIGAIITRRAPTCEPITFATMATLLAAALILPAALLIEGLPQAPGRAPLFALVFLGLVPTALANLLLVATIRSAGPSFVSLVNYQVPVWSVLFGWAFLSETLPARVFVALALILAGVAISQVKRAGRGSSGSASAAPPKTPD